MAHNQMQFQKIYKSLGLTLKKMSVLSGSWRWLRSGGLLQRQAHSNLPSVPTICSYPEPRRMPLDKIRGRIRAAGSGEMEQT